MLGNTQFVGNVVNFKSIPPKNTKAIQTTRREICDAGHNFRTTEKGNKYRALFTKSPAAESQHITSEEIGEMAQTIEKLEQELEKADRKIKRLETTLETLRSMPMSFNPVPRTTTAIPISVYQRHPALRFLPDINTIKVPQNHTRTSPHKNSKSMGLFNRTVKHLKQAAKRIEKILGIKRVVKAKDTPASLALLKELQCPIAAGEINPTYGIGPEQERRTVKNPENYNNINPNNKGRIDGIPYSHNERPDEKTHIYDVPKNGNRRRLSTIEEEDEKVQVEEEHVYANLGVYVEQQKGDISILEETYRIPKGKPQFAQNR